MLNWIAAIITLGIGGLIFLLVWRSVDRSAENQAWAELENLAGPPGGIFEPSMVEGLPEPAQRYFKYTIKAGAPLCRGVELEMSGELGFGSKGAPGYRPMTASQLLAPPYGLVWKVRSGLIAGSDGATPTRAWTRFWLAGLIPVARAGGTRDYARSAFGRVIAEAAFWAPAGLLPGENVSWEEVEPDTARAVVSFGDRLQAVDITVARDGKPTQVVIQRWSDVNPEKVFRAQPFGGYLTAFRDFDGYQLPTRVEGGNHFGTQDYFPFYKVNVTKVRCSGDGQS